MTDQDQSTGGTRTLLLLMTGVLLVAFGWTLSSGMGEKSPQTTAGDEEPNEVAIIEGQAITLEQLEEQAAERLGKLDMQMEQAKQKMKKDRRAILLSELELLVEEELLQREAESMGIDKEALVEREISGKLAAIVEEDVVAFHANLKTQRQGVPELNRIRDQIRTHLENTQSSEVRGAYLATLREKYTVEMLLAEKRTEIATVGHPSNGPDEAPIKIVEFSDFECPYCARVLPTMEQVKKTYGDKVQIVFRQFPLSIHANAQKAAEASLCAHDQGKFWAMHDLIFEEQKQLAVDDLKDKAQRLGLDTGRFDTCLDSGQFEEQVQDDVRDGFVAGVTSTPSLFVNGLALTGAQPYPAIAAMIDSELKKVGSAE